MKDKSLNIFIKAGMLLLAITLLIKHTPIIKAPDDMLGFFTGMAFALQLFGVFRMTPAYAQVKNFKKSIFKRS